MLYYRGSNGRKPHRYWKCVKFCFLNFLVIDLQQFEQTHLFCHEKNAEIRV